MYGEIDVKWGCALTLAHDDYAKENEPPNLQPLRNGDTVIGSNGSYYMGGVNNGDGLSKPFLWTELTFTDYH